MDSDPQEVNERLIGFIGVEMAEDVIEILNLTEDNENEILKKIEEIKTNFVIESNEGNARELEEKQNNADQHMEELIREEEKRLRELKEKAEKMQFEKGKGRKRKENRKMKEHVEKEAKDKKEQNGSKSFSTEEHSTDEMNSSDLNLDDLLNITLNNEVENNSLNGENEKNGELVTDQCEQDENFDKNLQNILADIQLNGKL